MARKPSGKKPNLTVVGGAAPGIGHNSGADGATLQQLSDEQQQALFFQHRRQIKSLKEKMASINSDLRNAYKKAKADGFPKYEFDFAETLDKDEDDKAINRRRREAEIARWLVHPIGTQADLFQNGATTDSRPIRERAFDEGKRAGIESTWPLSPPSNYSPASDGYEGYVEGWHAGQAALFAIRPTPPAGASLLRPAENEPGKADDFDSAADGDDRPWPDDEQIEARKEESAEAF